MSLNVDAPDGVGETAEKGIHVVWDTLNDVVTTLQSQGFTLIEKPIYQLPAIKPNDYASATSHHYSQWFAAYEGWQSYTSQAMHWAQAKKLEIHNERTKLAASIRKGARKLKPKPSEDAINDMVETTQRIIELTREEQQWRQYELMLEPQHEHIKATLKLLSRHLAVRQFEADLAGGRGSRMYGQ